MDTTDPEIVFDADGFCNHCSNYLQKVHLMTFKKDEEKKELSKIIIKIKAEGKNKPYDCIIGVSGGADSTYTAYKVKELGLRPLAVHFDNGWDSELAVKNIELTLKKLKIDLYTYVINWEEFKDIQLSFLKASTPDSEIPTDHAIYALLYRIAVKNKVRYIISGNNFTTEGILPKAWSQGHLDWNYIKTIQKKFGTVKLKSFPYYNFYHLVFYNRFKRLKVINILDYLDYHKQQALKVIKDELGWRDYGGKHHESVYTRFFQAYILPKKFSFDKRKAHLSTLICNGQITREEALDALKKDLYQEELLRDDKQFVIKKLGLSEDQFEIIMNLPIKKYKDYIKYEIHPLFNLEKHFFNSLIKIKKKYTPRFK